MLISIDQVIIVGLLAATFRLLTPLLLAGISELLVERAGVLNLGIEGIMLFGAFSAFMTTYITGDPVLGMVVAAAVGVAVAMLFAAFSIIMALDQIVSGLAINLVAIGATSYLFRTYFATYISVAPPSVRQVIPPTPIPLLSDLPVIGEAIFNHSFFTYLAILLLPFAAFLLYRTTWGLSIRAAGEEPSTADNLGVDVLRLRMGLLGLEGVLGGLAGSLLSISQYNMFLDNMTEGRGYVIVALIILGRWSPLKFFLGVLLFAFIDALQLRVQAAGIIGFPHQFALMMPYLVTLIALIVVGRRVRGPAFLSKPYKKIR